MHIEDSPEVHVQDTIKSGRGLCDSNLVATLADNAADAISFLESFNLDLSVVSQCGGHSAPRTHREPNTPDGKPKPVGYDIVQALKKHLEAQDPSRFHTILKARVVRLLTSDTNQVTGVAYLDTSTQEEKQAHGDAVILTTGGYSSDTNGFLHDFAPALAALPTTNGPFATGDGIRLAVPLGAVMKDMDKVGQLICLPPPLVLL